MKAKFVPGNPTNNITFFEIDGNGKEISRYSFYINFSSSNCKLAIAENFGGLSYGYSGTSFIQREDAKELLKEAFKLVNRNILITILDKNMFTWLKDNFEYYYAVEVPAGYNDGMQYHILIRACNTSRPPVKQSSNLTTKAVLDIVTKAFDMTQARQPRLKIIEEELTKLENQNK